MNETDPLAGFPVVIDQPVDWGDMDSYRHVNNVVYFRFFENARIELMRHLGWLELERRDGLGPIVAAVSARFRRPVAYPDTLRSAVRVGPLSADRFTLEHRLVSRRDGLLTTEGESVVVSYDYRAGAKTPIPDEIRRRIAELSV